MRPRFIRFHLLLTVLLFCTNARATADSMRVREFIDDWKQIVADHDRSCSAILSFYSDTVCFYNVTQPKQQICTNTGQGITIERALFEPDYKIESVAGSVNTWRAVFDNAPNMFGTDKFHYLIVQEISKGMLMITAHSSLADDLWLVQLEKIKSNVISDRNGKKYYVLNEDSVTFPGRRLYFLTDTLAFDVPWFYGVCVDTSLAYYARGNIFVAMTKPNSRRFDCIRDVTKELNARIFEQAELMDGGFPCFIQQDAATPSGALVNQWVVPEIRWTKGGTDAAEIQLRCTYNYGDACPVAYITIQVLERKKKIEVSKVMVPVVKRVPH